MLQASPPATFRQRVQLSRKHRVCFVCWIGIPESEKALVYLGRVFLHYVEDGASPCRELMKSLEKDRSRSRRGAHRSLLEMYELMVTEP